MPLVGTPISGSYDDVPVYGFTTEARVKALYGQKGWTYIFEDASGGDKTLIFRGLLADVEQSIITYLGQYFDPEDMKNSRWIQTRATWMLAHMVSKRRGNEHYFEDLYESALRELTAMATGEIPPPQDIPLRTYTLPTMSNFVMDDRFRSAKIRVVPHISEGETYPGQNVAHSFDAPNL